MNTVTPKAYDVQLQKVPPVDGQLSDIITSACCFCDRIIEMSPTRFEACKNLAHGRFHCPFCIRHNLHHKDNKNVLILNFKGIIGYYYYVHHKEMRVMWQGQILSFVNDHKEIGLLNPIFSYDEDDFMWFVDFNKVGKTKHKMPVTEVYKTVNDMIGAFKLKSHISFLNTTTLYDKYKRAMELFYTQRQRPPDRRILAPTLKDCGGCMVADIDYEAVKNISLNFFLTQA